MLLLECKVHYIQRFTIGPFSKYIKNVNINIYRLKRHSVRYEEMNHTI